MFSIARSYNGYTLPLSELYVDTIGDQYTWDNIVIVSTKADATLTLSGVQATCRFNGDSFPLSGTDYLSAVTGTLEITITEQLETGLYWYSFLNVVETFVPVAGITCHGCGVDGLGGALVVALPVQVRVQSFSIPGVSLAPENVVPASIPFGYPRRT